MLELDLAGRVAKRVRVDAAGSAAGSDADGPSRRARSACASAPLAPSQPQLNLAGAAGALASTQTHGTQVPPLVLVPKNKDGGGCARPVPGPARTDAARLGVGTLNCGAPRAARTAPSTRQHDAYDVCSVAAPPPVTWDAVGAAAAARDAAPHTGSAVGVATRAAVCDIAVDFDALTKRHVVRAAANAIAGLESVLVTWDAPTMQLCVVPAARASAVGDYLAVLARCGSYVRRLRHAARSIRELVAPEHRVALALAEAIDAELVELTRLPARTGRGGLVELYAHGARANALALSLARLVGCADLTERGRLLRVPDAVALLERAYGRALLQQAQRWHGAMLWRLVAATIGPWLDELSFVVGLSEQAVPRTAARALQAAHFPECFVRVDEEAARAVIDKALVPNFVAPSVARAAARCYNTLIVLGIKGGAGVAAARTALLPLSLRGRRKLYPREAGPLCSLASAQPGSVQQGVHAVLANLGAARRTTASPPAPVPAPPAPPASAGPASRSVEAEIWRALVPVLVREDELNRAAKQALRSDLAHTQRVVSGVYLLGDGVFWSVFQDLVGRMAQDWANAPSYVVAMDALVGESYPGVSFYADSESRLPRLKVSFPAAIEAALSVGYTRNFEAAFARLLALHRANDTAAFAVLATEATLVARKISSALEDAACGLREAVRAFGSVSLLLEAPAPLSV